MCTVEFRGKQRRLKEIDEEFLKINAFAMLQKQIVESGNLTPEQPDRNDQSAHECIQRIDNLGTEKALLLNAPVFKVKKVPAKK